MPRGTRTEADSQLAEALNAAGVTVRSKPTTATQLQGWRSLGLLPAVQVTHAGRRGKTSTYPEGAFDQAVDVARVVDEIRSLNRVVLIRFGNGYPSNERAVREAYDEITSRQDDSIERSNAAVDDSDALTRSTYQLVAGLATIVPGMRESFAAAAADIVANPALDHATGADEVMSTREAKEHLFSEAALLLKEGSPLGSELAHSLGVDHFLARTHGVTTSEVHTVLNGPVVLPREMRELLGHLSFADLCARRDAVLRMIKVIREAMPLAVPELFECDICRGEMAAGMALQLPRTPKAEES